MQNIPPENASTEALLARIRSLQLRQNRDRLRVFFLEGVRQFVQAHDAHLPFECILTSPVLLQSPLAQMLSRRLRSARVPHHRLTPEQFRAISQADRASGVAAIARQHWTTFESLKPQQLVIYLVIEHIRCPGNLGSILRTAEATGVHAVIFVGPLSDPFHPHTLRASMGGIFHVPLIRTSPHQLAHFLRQHNIHLVGLSPALRTSGPISRATSPSPLRLAKNDRDSLQR